MEREMNYDNFSEEKLREMLRALVMQLTEEQCGEILNEIGEQRVALSA